MKQVLVKNGNHQRPMLAVLDRYNIGSLDKYGRGRWISVNDLPDISDRFDADKTAIRYPETVFVMGTNRHNYVNLDEFYKLFD